MHLGMHRAPDAAINIQGGDTEGGASADTVPSSREKEEEVRTKIAMMVAMVVVLVALVGSGAALAQTIGGAIQCQTVPCIATGDHQVLFERVGDGVRDRMIAQAGSSATLSRSTKKASAPK